MKTIIKKYKAAIVIFMVIGLVLFLFVTRKKPDSVPATNPTPRPTTQAESRELTLIAKSPENEEFTSLWSTEKLTFVFNRNIDPSSLKYRITPNVDSKTAFDESQPNQIAIVPVGGWNLDTKYTIEITHLASLDGVVLLDPIQTSITRRFTDEDAVNIPDPD